ncbi:MAG: HDOD domain-containing protein [Planctomycetota bacterium]
MSISATTTQEQNAKATLSRLGNQLPVRPGPLLDLLACKGDEAREVTQIIERDPAMTARVLGVVNSAGNRRLNEITELSRAVLQLGPSQVRTLGLAMGLQMLAEQMQLGPEMIRGFWNASLRKAEAAHLAAQVIDPDRQASAYSAGLIADIGLPLLMGLDPDFYENHMPLRGANQSWSDAERAHFGLDHAQAGAHVLNEWKVSAETCRRVRNHHQLPSDDNDAGLVLALFVAGLLPHDDGEIDPVDLDRLMAVHGKTLSHAYATPDAFLGHVYVESQRRLNRDIEKDSTEGLELQPFLDAISSNTIELVSQLCSIKNSQSKQKEDLSNLRFEAFTDPLTKVLNRRGFFGLAEQRFAKAPQGLSACCMMLDMNGFKPINDQFGHDAGDLMLRGIAKLLRRSVSRSDIIGRLGGDEFAVLITDIDEHAARVAASRLRDTCLGKKVRVTPDQTCEISFSLGAIYHDCVGLDVQLDQLLAGADELMYQRKRGGQPGMIFAPFGQGNGDSTMSPVVA